MRAPTPIPTLWCIATLGLMIQFGCQASEEKSPLVSFNTSDCKLYEDPDLEINEVLTTVDEVSLSGLRCISWTYDVAGTTRIKLINFDGPCGPDWQGAATIGTIGGLTLEVTDPECPIIQPCGACLYDWFFEINGIDLSADVPLKVEVNYCPGHQDSDIYKATIPKGETTGLLCIYAGWDGVREQAATEGGAGKPHMSCRQKDPEAADEVDPCDEPLVCGSNGDGEDDHDICLFPCESDTDCPLRELLTCQDGRCRIAEPWTE